jgi:hypothetical protein
MEDRMTDMAADTALWLILAAAAVFIACGCHLTRRRPPPQVAKEPVERRLDRAA